MSTIYVLLVIVSGSRGAAMVTQEFNSELDCRTAATQVVLTFNKSRHYLQEISTDCLKKGDL